MIHRREEILRKKEKLLTEIYSSWMTGLFQGLGHDDVTERAGKD